MIMRRSMCSIYHNVSFFFSPCLFFKTLVYQWSPEMFARLGVILGNKEVASKWDKFIKCDFSILVGVDKREGDNCIVVCKVEASEK